MRCGICRIKYEYGVFSAHGTEISLDSTDYIARADNVIICVIEGNCKPVLIRQWVNATNA